MIILIPAYEPDEKLIMLINELKIICDYKIVIVNDGSGSEYTHIFERAKELSCEVIGYEKNMGKGFALKTGFKYIMDLEDESDGVVTCDCDGQHSIFDIIKVSNEVLNNQNTLIIGGRRFTGKVPLKNKMGNTISRIIYSFATGNLIYDTQTGLRGFSISMLKWLLEIPGNRFEYETNMLLSIKSSIFNFKEVPIETIYIGKNTSSHFRALSDSVKVIYPILKFMSIGISSFLIDFVLLIFFQSMTNNLLLSIISARILSGLYNYIMNKNHVFSTGKNTFKNSLLKYIILAVCVLSLNYILIYLLSKVAFISLAISKVMAELIIFAISYMLQKRFVFTAK